MLLCRTSVSRVASLSPVALYIAVLVQFKTAYRVALTESSSEHVVAHRVLHSVAAALL
jgi:hypothetical protein